MPRIDIWDVEAAAKKLQDINCGYPRDFSEHFQVDRILGKGGFGLVRYAGAHVQPARAGPMRPHDAGSPAIWTVNWLGRWPTMRLAMAGSVLGTTRPPARSPAARTSLPRTASRRHSKRWAFPPAPVPAGWS